MNAYSLKLLNPKWGDFRQKVFDHYGYHCRVCGTEKPADRRNHVHHRRYIKDREPWEYEMEDVTVLCRECHEEIHKCEDSWRDLIRAMPAWMMTEMQSLVDALGELDPDAALGVVSHAKNEARSALWGRMRDQ